MIMVLCDEDDDVPFNNPLLIFPHMMMNFPSFTQKIPVSLLCIVEDTFPCCFSVGLNPEPLAYKVNFLATSYLNDISFFSIWCTFSLMTGFVWASEINRYQSHVLLSEKLVFKQCSNMLLEVMFIYFNFNSFQVSSNHHLSNISNYWKSKILLPYRSQ